MDNICIPISSPVPLSQHIIIRQGLHKTFITMKISLEKQASLN